MSGSRMTVLVDTREQDPWEFRGPGIVTVRRKLDTGDYSLGGHHVRGIALERKSVADLFGSMTSGRERFLRELDRLAVFKSKWVIVEGTLLRVLHGSHMTAVNPSRMVDSLFAECGRRGIIPVFCKDRIEAAETAKRTLLAHRALFG